MSIPRNVRGCWNSGYCGFGCPVNAKQSMLVSTIPEALRHGATLVHRLRVRQLQHAGDKITGAVGEALRDDGRTPSGTLVTIKARHFIAAGGAINTPALLLRSQLPDPHKLLGKHTLIHPVVLSLAQMPERIDPFYGAPQSTASDHFQWKDGATGPMGYKLEVPPIFPGIGAGVLNAYGDDLRKEMAALPHTNAVLALLRDGFVEQSPGGSIRLADDGSPMLDYDAQRLRVGRREARLPEHGRAAVRGRRPAGAPGAHRCELPDQLDRCEEGDCRAAAEEVPRHAVHRTPDGRLRDEPEPEARRRRQRRPASSDWPTCR